MIRLFTKSCYITVIIMIAATVSVGAEISSASSAKCEIRDGGRFVVANSLVERIIETAPYLRTVSFVNKTATPALNKSVDSKEFTLALDDEKLILTSANFAAGEPEIRREGKTTILRIPLQCDKHGVNVVVSYSLGDDDFYLRKHLEIDTGKHLLNWVDVEFFRIPDSELQRFDTEPMPFRMEPWDINVGRPLFAGRNMFLGLEHPASINSFDERQWITLRQHPGRRGIVTTAPAVIGFCPDRPRERLADYFEEYIDRNRAQRPRRSIQWVAYFNVSMSDDQCREKIAVAERVFRRRGVPLDMVMMDSGWTERQSIMRVNSQYPDRLALVKKLAKERLNAELGLHAITSGVKRWVDKDYLAAQGYDMIYHTNSKDGAYCFGDPRVFEEFRNNLVSYTKAHAIASYKFDWGFFVCGKASHRGHLPGEKYGFEAGADNFIRVHNALREANPDIFLYNTGWFSPWWLWSYDAIFAAGADYNFGLSGPPSYDTSSLLCSWRDATIRGNIVRWSPFFPINSLMTVDPISYWWHVWDMHSESPLRPFIDYFVMACLRGTQLTEIYNNISAWSDAHADAAADVLKWMKAHDDVILASTRYIGGDPLAGDPYGYAHFTKSNRGIIVVRNPSIVPRNIKIPLDETAGMWPGDKQCVVSVVYPFKETMNKTVGYGDVCRQELAGNEVRVLEICPLESLKEPLPIGCRYRVVKRESTSTSFELCGNQDDLQFFSPIELAKAKAVDGSQHCYSLKPADILINTINAEDRQPDALNATAKNITDVSARMEKNAYVASLNVPERAQARASLLFDEAGIAGSMSLDGKMVEPDAPHIRLRDAAGRTEVNQGMRAAAKNWSLFGLELERGRHELRFQPAKQTTANAQVIVELRRTEAPRQIVKIEHDPLARGNELELPRYWAWQQRSAETITITARDSTRTE